MCAYDLMETDDPISRVTSPTAHLLLQLLLHPSLNPLAHDRWTCHPPLFLLSPFRQITTIVITGPRFFLSLSLYSYYDGCSIYCCSVSLSAHHPDLETESYHLARPSGSKKTGADVACPMAGSVLCVISPPRIIFDLSNLIFLIADYS